MNEFGLRGRLPKLPPEQRFPLKWAHEYLVSPPTISFPVDVTGGITDFGMMGNGDWGDCAEAAEVHAEMTTAAAAGTTGPPPNSPLAVQRYQQFCNATTPPGPGTSLPVYLQQLFQAGIIKAWAPVDQTNRAMCISLMSAGFGLYIGVNLYDQNEQQFASGQPFDVVSGQAPNPDDGHCVWWVKSQSMSGPDAVVTWALAWPVTYAWMWQCLHQNPDGEAYLIVTTEEQLALFEPALVADCQALGGSTAAPEPPVAPPVAPQSFLHRIEEVVERTVDEVARKAEDEAKKVFGRFSDPAQGPGFRS